MSSHKDDLDLLLSLRERVLDTPPGSPSPHSPGYLSEDRSPRRSEKKSDMSVFRDTVRDFLDYEYKPVQKAGKLKGSKASNYTEVEKFSGLRIRNRLVSAAELGELFSDVCFVQNLWVGDTLSGCWATVGVLTEKGTPKTSSTGKNYCIWQVGCLDENTKNWNEPAGTVFALFNCAVRKDAVGTGFSLSVYSPTQILKIGTAVDYGVCKGKRKDGMPCTIVINKLSGICCKYHTLKASEKCVTNRAELKGGNLGTACRDSLSPEGICMVDSLEDRMNFKKPIEPLKLLSVEGLKKTLSNAGKVMTRTYSQGIRFLTAITGTMISTNPDKESTVPKQPINMSEKRKSSTMEEESSVIGNQQPDAKRKKAEQRGLGVVDKTRQDIGKLIQLDIVSSDEEL
ncbi:hypothetical protein I3843_06G116300 [Carya illinoinensis]|nr:hypothetical protein I3760_06G124200 [Carya illinoinensis]KAG7975773.1 hypothetical protein I3843_06G116300 [Carya illinoinensis]